MAETYVDIPIKTDSMKRTEATAFREVVGQPGPPPETPPVFAPTPAPVPETERERREREARETLGQRGTRFQTVTEEGLIPTAPVRPDLGSIYGSAGISDVDQLGPPMTFKESMTGLGRGAYFPAQLLFGGLDVFGQTVTEGIQGEVPTLFTEGFEASLEKFEDRPLWQQITIGVATDPIVVAKLLRVGFRVGKAGVRIANAGLREAAEKEVVERVGRDAPKELKVVATEMLIKEAERAALRATDPTMVGAMAREGLQYIGAKTGVSVRAGRVADQLAGALRPEVAHAREMPKLPSDLVKATPKYGRRDLVFANDIDRALYIIGNPKLPRSKADSRYLKFVMDETGLDETAAREAGQAIRKSLKVLAKETPSDEAIQVPFSNPGMRGRQLAEGEAIARAAIGGAARAAEEVVETARFVKNPYHVGGKIDDVFRVVDDTDLEDIVVESAEQEQLVFRKVDVEYVTPEVPDEAISGPRAGVGPQPGRPTSSTAVEITLPPGATAEQQRQAQERAEALVRAITGEEPPPGGPPGPAGAAAAGGEEIPGQFAKAQIFADAPPSGLRKVLAAARHPVKSIKAAYDIYQRNMTDRLVYINEMTTRAKKQFKEEMGYDMPDSMNAELQSALLGGAPRAGVEIYMGMYDAMTRVLKRFPVDALTKKNMGVHYVNTFLRLKHAQSIMSSDPERFANRVMGVGDNQIKGLAGVNSALAQMARELGPEQMAQIEEASRIVAKTLEALFDRKAASGLVDPQLAAFLKEKYPWYNPTRYAQQDLIPHVEEGVGRALSGTSNDLHRLTEVGFEANPVAPLDAIASHIVSSEVLIRRNGAAQAILEAALRDSTLVGRVKRLTGPVLPGEKRGTISVMRNGKREVWEVPKELETAAKDMSAFDVNALERTFDIANSVPRSFLTAHNPVFMAGNFMVDMVTVATTKGVMPWETATSLMATMKNLLSEDRVLQEFFLSGGDVSGLAGKSATEIMRDAAAGGQIVLDNRRGVMDLINPFNAWKNLGRISSALELAPRRATFKKALKKGKTPAQAAREGRRATVDFARSGSAIRRANHFWLYLNAGVQGSLLPYRAARQNPGLVAKGLAGLFLWQGALYAWNRQFPEYRNVPGWDKYTSNFVMLSSEERDKYGKKVPHYFKIVPFYREFSPYIAAINYLFEQLDQKTGYIGLDTEGRPAPEGADLGAGAFWNLFTDHVLSNINPLGSVIQTDDGGISNIPVPSYFAETIRQVVTNDDPYFDRPIVSDELKRSAIDPKTGKYNPALEYDETTSDIAKLIGETFTWSPKKIDHLMRFGLARDIMSAASVAIRAFDLGEDVDPKVEELAAQLEFIQENVWVLDEMVSTHRSDLLSQIEEDYGTEMVRKVLAAERAPDPTKPLWTTVKNRFYKRQGGGLRIEGIKAAHERLGLDEEQTRQAAQDREVFSEHLSDQYASFDADLESGKIDRAGWREGQNVLGQVWAAWLERQRLQFPKAANLHPEIYAEYNELVHTISGELPDQRSKAELLYAGYRAIFPENDPITQEPDMDSFFARQQAYRDDMNAEDRKLFQEHRNARMSSYQIEYDADMQRIQSYWADPMADALAQLTAKEVQVWKDWEMAGMIGKQDIENRHPVVIALVKRTLQDGRKIKRVHDPEIDRLLLKWWPNYTPVTMEGIEQEAENIGTLQGVPRPARPRPAFGGGPSISPPVPPVPAGTPRVPPPPTRQEEPKRISLKGVFGPRSR